MNIFTILLVLLVSASAFAQKTFDLKDASKFFDIKVSVAECDDMYCKGKTTFSFFKKGGTSAYQVISLPDTQIQLGYGGQPR